jgi:hypothetical protein
MELEGQKAFGRRKTTLRYVQADPYILYIGRADIIYHVHQA